MEQIKDEAKNLIKEMRFAQVDDDEFIAFADRYQDLRTKLEACTDEEIDILITALDKAYERLGQQLTFCTKI